MRIIILTFTLFLCGCGVNQKFIKSVEKNWYAIRPEYIEYVKNDESLVEIEKEVRMATVEMFDNLIIKAKNDQY